MLFFQTYCLEGITWRHSHVTVMIQNPVGHPEIFTQPSLSLTVGFPLCGCGVRYYFGGWDFWCFNQIQVNWSRANWHACPVRVARRWHNIRCINFLVPLLDKFAYKSMHVSKNWQIALIRWLYYLEWALSICRGCLYKCLPLSKWYFGP